VRALSTYVFSGHDFCCAVKALASFVGVIRIVRAVPRTHISSLEDDLQMQRLFTRSLVAMAFAAVAHGQLAAQTNSFVPGSAVNSPALTGFVTTGIDMVDMLVTWTWSDGTSAGAAWANLGGNNCGVAGDGVSVTFDCDQNTFDQGGGLSRWLIANGSDRSLASVRFNGAPGRTLFDCDWNGQTCENMGSAAAGTGTTGSANGWSHEQAGGSFGGSVLGEYSNLVSVSGIGAVGDLFEQLTITFVGGMDSDLTYEFYADTDNSLFDAPPPTVVPEPSTYAMMLVGLAGIGGLVRRRRRNG
jgi:hypothetical protein